MNNIKIYLSSFTPDHMMFLIELLKKDNGLLKTKYYEASFIMNGSSKNEFEITNIKEIDDILPYLETVYNDRNLKEYELDETTTANVVKILCETLRKGNLKSESNISSLHVFNNLNGDYKIDNRDNKVLFNIYKEDQPPSHSDYMINKKSIKNYLNNSKRRNNKS